MPQPSDSRLDEIYGTSYYEPWQWEDKDVVQGFKARTFLHGLRRADPRTGDRLLDVGCAQGELAATAANLGLDVLGVDINRDAIERARGVFHKPRSPAESSMPASSGPIGTS